MQATAASNNVRDTSTLLVVTKMAAVQLRLYELVKGIIQFFLTLQRRFCFPSDFPFHVLLTYSLSAFFPFPSVIKVSLIIVERFYVLKSSELLFFSHHSPSLERLERARAHSCTEYQKVHTCGKVSVYKKLVQNLHTCIFSTNFFFHFSFHSTRMVALSL